MKDRNKTLLVLVVLFICVFLPTFATVPFPQQDSTLVIKEVLVKTSVAYLWLSPTVHVVTVVLLVALYLYGSRVGRVVDVFFAILFLFVAFSNHIAVTDTYGLAIVTGNLVPILIVGLFWVWEVYRPQNNYVFERLPAWRFWVLPFAFLAFWSPIDAQLNPDFNPLLLLNSSFGVMYCATTPVIVALLTLIYPRVNTYVLRTTSFVGLIMGLFNVMSYFIMPGYTLWNLVLHTPLIFISLYGLLIPMLVKKNLPHKNQKRKEQDRKRGVSREASPLAVANGNLHSDLRSLQHSFRAGRRYFLFLSIRSSFWHSARFTDFVFKKAACAVEGYAAVSVSPIPPTSQLGVH